MDTKTSFFLFCRALGALLRTRAPMCRPPLSRYAINSEWSRGPKLHASSSSPEGPNEEFEIN